MFRHIIYAIVFRQLANNTAGCFNNIVFTLVAKISSKKVCEKMKNSLTLENVLLACNRNAELLRLVGAPYDSKAASLRRIRNKNLIILKRLQKKKKKIRHFLLWNTNWKCSENNMLTERTYDSAVLKFFLNIITICVFIQQ